MRSKNTVRIAISLLGLVIQGCFRPTYSTEFVSDADYGVATSQREAEDGAKQFMKGHLKDPFSAQYDWRDVKPAWIHMQPTAFNPRIYGYALEGLLNAKNGYAAYVGFKPYRFFFRDGELRQVAKLTSGNIWWQIHPPAP